MRDSSDDRIEGVIRRERTVVRLDLAAAASVALLVVLFVWMAFVPF